MGTRLFEELESLRDLKERQGLEEAKRALEESGRQRDLLIKEADHRVKNSLQIVSSLLHMQAKTAGAAANQFHNAAARVAAIAAVHQQLQQYDNVGTVALDRYLIDLCREIRTASSGPDLAWSLVVDADPLIIYTDVAVPLALIAVALTAGCPALAADDTMPPPRKMPRTSARDMPGWVLELSRRWLAKSMQELRKSCQPQVIRSR